MCGSVTSGEWLLPPDSWVPSRDTPGGERAGRPRDEGCAGSPGAGLWCCLGSEGSRVQVDCFSPRPALFLSRDISSLAQLRARVPGPDETGLWAAQMRQRLGPRKGRAGHKAELSLGLFALCFSGYFFLVGRGPWWLPCGLVECLSSSGGVFLILNFGI